MIGFIICNIILTIGIAFHIIGIPFMIFPFTWGFALIAHIIGAYCWIVSFILRIPAFFIDLFLNGPFLIIGGIIMSVISLIFLIGGIILMTLIFYGSKSSGTSVPVQALVKNSFGKSFTKSLKCK